LEVEREVIMEDVIIGLLIAVVTLLVFIAYLVNIVYLVRAQSVNGLTLARVVGIFVFPLGVILGFISNNDKE
jgi:hypothetical protein